jgi:protein-tyrosine-phosphatase
VKCLIRNAKISSGFENPKTILFVCVENSFRSQIAEAFFNKFAPKRFRAISAGTVPADAVNSKAIKVMGEIGIDISKQKPKRLTHDLVEKADIVITMGCGAEACPFIEGAVDWGIEDPKDKPMDRVREVRDEIKGRVEKLLESISSQNSN